MVRSWQAALVLGCALLGAGVLGVGPAAAAGTDDPPTPVCFTYYPSEVPTDAGTDTAVASDTAGPTEVGTATDTGTATATVVATDTAVAVDTDVPTDTGVATDTAVPTDQPSGPYTACAAPGIAGGAGDGSTDPLAQSGSDTALLAVISAALIGVGIALSMFTARHSRARRTH